MIVRLLLVVCVLAAVAGGAIYARGLDPRPVNEAMKRDIAAQLEVLHASAAPADVHAMSAAYVDFARAMARVELAYGTDPDLRAYAEQIVDRPLIVAARPLPAAELQAMHATLLASLSSAPQPVGTADDRFAQVMLPLERSLAELGRLASADPPASALRANDPATLMSASVVPMLEAWSTKSAHSH